MRCPPDSFGKPDLDSWSGIDFLSAASKRRAEWAGPQNICGTRRHSICVYSMSVCVSVYAFLFVCMYFGVYWYLRVSLCLCVCYGFLHLHLSLQICPFLKCEKTHNVLFACPSLPRSSASSSLRPASLSSLPLLLLPFIFLFVDDILPRPPTFILCVFFFFLFHFHSFPFPSFFPFYFFAFLVFVLSFLCLCQCCWWSCWFCSWRLPPTFATTCKLFALVATCALLWICLCVSVCAFSCASGRGNSLPPLPSQNPAILHFFPRASATALGMNPLEMELDPLCVARCACLFRHTHPHIHIFMCLCIYFFLFVRMFGHWNFHFSFSSGNGSGCCFCCYCSFSFPFVRAGLACT